MLERDYQALLIKEIKKRLPGAVVLKNDSSYQQGIPDLSVFWMDRWAWLEVKKSKDETEEPNQPYFVGWADEHSFGAFIYPENESEVLDALQRSFTSGRIARVS